MWLKVAENHIGSLVKQLQIYIVIDIVSTSYL